MSSETDRILPRCTRSHRRRLTHALLQFFLHGFSLHSIRLFINKARWERSSFTSAALSPDRIRPAPAHIARETALGFPCSGNDPSLDFRDFARRRSRPGARLPEACKEIDVARRSNNLPSMTRLKKTFVHPSWRDGAQHRQVIVWESLPVDRAVSSCVNAYNLPA